MGVCVGAMATTMMDTILQAGSVCAFLAVGLYFFCEAAGVVPKGAYAEGQIEAGYPLFLDVLLKGINMVLLALLGAGCMLWPHIETRFARRADAKQEDEPRSPKQVADVESGASEPEGVPPPQKTKKPKRAKLYYLTHMKTFLTFFVVTFHVAISWNGVAPFPETSVAKAFLYWFHGINYNYFMAAFFLISAYFCPSSLDRKGFRMFVLDKMVRLGIPFLLMMNALGAPLYNVVVEAIEKKPMEFTFLPGNGVTWFIIRLLDFSVLYAVIAQVMPVIKLKMPSPILLSIAGFAFGIIYHALALFIPDTYKGVWYSQNGWQFELSLYIWFFIAGIVGGRNGWLHSIENMPRRTVWFLRILVAAILSIWLALNIVVTTGVVPQPDPMGLQWLIAGFTHGI